MLGKCLLFSGIKNHQMVELGQINNLKFYAERNKTEPYNILYVEINGHMLVAGNVIHMENIANKIKNEQMDLHKWIEDSFNEYLEKGQSAHLGYAEYLNRLPEALEHNKRLYELNKQKQAEKQKKRQEEEERLNELEQQAITGAGEQFKQGEAISGDLFLKLCDKHQIQLPLRTRGWIKKCLCEVDCDSYVYRGKNGSTVVLKYAKMLKEVI
jgi:hypothetical protein